MKTTAAVLATTIVAITTLSGCGGSDPYCDAVDKNKDTLNTFGQKRTDAAYAKYAKVLADIGKKAPSDISKDWAELAEVTGGIVKAHKQTKIPLEDTKKFVQAGKVSKSQRDILNAANAAFNETTKQRNAVVKNVKQECKIDLK